MKDWYDVEVTYKDEVIGRVEAKTPSELMFGQDITAKIVNNRIFDDLCDEIYTDVHAQFKKFNSIMITFLNDEDYFICSIRLTPKIFNKKKYKLNISDWQGQEILLKFATDEDLESEE